MFQKYTHIFQSVFVLFVFVIAPAIGMAENGSTCIPHLGGKLEYNTGGVSCHDTENLISVTNNGGCTEMTKIAFYDWTGRVLIENN